MHNPALHSLFNSVRRRLLLQRLATALRRTAWVVAAILLVMALVHVFVVRLDVTAVIAAALLPWLAAAAWVASHRTTPAECAGWADRHLGGTSAYATLLETAGEQPPRPASPAVECLLQWVEAAVPRSQAMLHALPLHLRLAKPVMALLVSAVLTAILLQIPARHAATKWNPRPGTPVLQTERDARVTATPSDQPAAGATESATAAQSSRGQASETPRTDQLTATNAGQDSAGKERALTTTAPAPGPSGSRAAAGGREAGDSADTLEDTGISASWQGELARRLIATTTTADNVPTRADPARTADYAVAINPQDAASAVPRHLPAPAAPPEARPRSRLGPAEQAYVRAYFAGSGATP